MIYMGFFKFLAEAVRFELTEDSHPRQFSRLLHSTALPRFRARSLTVRQVGFGLAQKKKGGMLFAALKGDHLGKAHIEQAPVQLER